MGKLRLQKSECLVHRHRAHKSLIKPKPMSLEPISKNIIIISNFKIQTENIDLFRHHEKHEKKNLFNSKLLRECNKLLILNTELALCPHLITKESYLCGILIKKTR